MDLRQRLALLRRQSGASQTTASPPMSHMPDSVAERLQRLRGTSLDRLPHTNRDEHVARLLQG